MFRKPFQEDIEKANEYGITAMRAADLAHQPAVLQYLLRIKCERLGERVSGIQKRRCEALQILLSPLSEPKSCTFCSIRSSGRPDPGFAAA